MTGLQRHQTEQTTPAAEPVVWILSKGEMYEGGHIIGVFLDRDLARGAFATEAKTIEDTFSIDNATQSDDGTIRLEGGCDWVDLEPHTVITAYEIDA